VQNDYFDLIKVVDPYEIYVEVVVINPIGSITVCCCLWFLIHFVQTFSLQH